VVAQGDDRIEVIAVDDGSSDATVSILEDYADRLPLRLVARKRLGNWTATTNAGLAIARAEHACFLHQDDCWLPNRLHVLKPLLDQYPQAALFLHPSWYIDIEGRRVGRWQCPLPHHGQPLAPEFVLERLLVQNFISIPAPVFRRNSFLEAGGLDESLWYTADWDLWLKLAATGETVYYPEPLSCFRVHPLSQTLQNSKRNGGFGEQINNVLDRHMGRWEADSPRRKRSVRRAAVFSAAVNTAMVAHFHGQRPQLARLAFDGLALGFTGWHRFLRDSRIIERTLSRLRTQDLKKRAA
jgi:glycosyltransferase involved in cell wall biosynthesis